MPCVAVAELLATDVLDTVEGVDRFVIPSRYARAEFAGDIVVTDYILNGDVVGLHQIASESDCIVDGCISEAPTGVIGSIDVNLHRRKACRADFDADSVFVGGFTVERTAVVVVVGVTYRPTVVVADIWVELHDIAVIDTEVSRCLARDEGVVGGLSTSRLGGAATREVDSEVLDRAVLARCDVYAEVLVDDRHGSRRIENGSPCLSAYDAISNKVVLGLILADGSLGLWTELTIHGDAKVLLQGTHVSTSGVEFKGLHSGFVLCPCQKWRGTVAILRAQGGLIR